MMMKTTVTKIPVLSEKSALSIFGRVLSGERQVRIGEIVYADRVSAALDEHDLHTEGSICLHTERVSAALISASLISASLDEQSAHRAEPR